MTFLLILIIGTAIGYDLKCPAKAEWRLRANVSCYSEDKYVCLMNLLEEKYMEHCLGSDQSSIGSKLVFQPLFNLAECNSGRYQPIVFTTHGNSECIFFKSKCTEEGQVVFSNGVSSGDTACRCDYTEGYSFVTKPKNSCFCKSSEEDCSCFRSTCTKLSPDYQCITDGDKMMNETCLEIRPSILYNPDNDKIQVIESNIKSYSSAQNVVYIIIASMFVYFVFAVIVLLTVCVFVADDISAQINGNGTIDDERQKRIKLLLKGECGKLHFARLVFIGKNGVGKTSLMRRLLWQNREDVIATQSTDGIEVEKCNINIADGKWSPCNKIDDDLTRLIHQVYKVKNLNVECAAAETVGDQETVCSHAEESSRISDKILSKSSGESDHMGINYDDTDKNSNGNYKSDEAVLSGINRTDINAFTSDKRDNNVAEVTDLDQIKSNFSILKNVNDNKINSYKNESDSDLVNDEQINQMTSTIMKSYLKYKDEDQVDMAFCWLWDFAGQKDFYATHQVFLSQYAVYLLVTDSLEFSTSGNHGIAFEVSANYVSFWFDAIHCYWSTTKKDRLDPPIIVVCTNEDKIKEPLEREQRRKKFKDNLGKVLHKQKKKGHLRNIYFISNTEDADPVFEEIRKDISRQAMNMQDWGKECPLKWILFQQVLLKLKDSNVPISSTKKLLKIAKHKDIDISEDIEAKQCLQYCHDIGTVVYFDEENLADHVILDPKWLINAFRCLVSDNIENIIEVSDDWQILTDTGQLTDSLISLLFRKEPELKFEKNKDHLIEVMKRFDIIVNLKNSSALYMPCMVKSCSFAEVQRQFCDGNQPVYKTSWLCLEFKFLPPAFFNHIIAWYIKQYKVSVIIDKEGRSERNALYRQICIFDLDSSSCEQLVVCEGPNTIALQVWDSRMSKKTYGDLGSELFRFVETLQKRYSLQLSFTKTFTCKDGDFSINRKTMEDLVTSDYKCREHNTIHISDDLVKPWNSSKQLQVDTKNKTFIVIGEYGVGKTCLLKSYSTNKFRDEYIPTVFDKYTANVTVDSIPFTLELCDTSGKEVYDTFRRMVYPQTDVVLLCFSINDISSLENIEKKWIPEIQQFLPGVAQVLVGCKADLRDSNADTCITSSKVETFASDHNLPYCETSALTQIGLKACFDKAIIESN